jgi:hypothetical protein
LDSQVLGNRTAAGQLTATRNRQKADAHEGGQERRAPTPRSPEYDDGRHSKNQDSHLKSTQEIRRSARGVAPGCSNATGLQDFEQGSQGAQAASVGYALLRFRQAPQPLVAQASVLLDDFQNLRVIGLAENEMFVRPIPRVTDPLRLRSERKRKYDPIEQGQKG